MAATHRIASVALFLVCACGTSEQSGSGVSPDVTAGTGETGPSGPDSTGTPPTQSVPLPNTTGTNHPPAADPSQSPVDATSDTDASSGGESQTGGADGETATDGTSEAVDDGTSAGGGPVERPAAAASSEPQDDSSGADAGIEPSGPPSSGCQQLVTDPTINWRDSALKSDQEIVECLSHSLGRPVGYGEGALGGYDPAGSSKLVVITQSSSQSVEGQLMEALSGEDHAWVVFDKADFAQDFEIGMYRLHCSNPEVLDHLQASEAECLDYHLWCQNRQYDNDVECLEQFFNVALNDGDLPIRNPVIGSNKTIDGRMSEAYFRFSGFAIGADSSGEPTQTATSVILTHLRFEGAGHTEDHGLDPDMIRSTGASHDIWIHKNDFDLTGDSAFDVKVGAYDITMSFNRVMDVKRASLHGSSDSRTINEQITTTMHHNAFVTRDSQYDTLGNTGRRVPLIRRGTSHMWNNLFVNYRKDVLSVRVGANVLWQDNAMLVNEALQEKSSLEASLEELRGNLLRDIDDGNFRADGTFLWFSDGACNVNDTTQTALTQAAGTVDDLSLQYSPQSQAAFNAERKTAQQALVDYISATAGKYGELPFNSPFASSFETVVAQDKVPCQ